MLKILIIFLFLVPGQVNSARGSFEQKPCSDLQGKCDYYSCMNALYPCSRSNYLKKFALKYCNKFYEEIFEQVSDEGREWLGDVKLCLQLKVQDYIVKEKKENLSCRKLEDFAFETHSDCYVETGFCRLSKRERLLVAKTLGHELLKPKVQKEAFQILGKCRKISQ